MPFANLSQLVTLPIFPLEGALLLPGGDLPLNIFEPRYLAMTKAALAGDRLIGMIQPYPHQLSPAGHAQPFYVIGCAGRISHFEETPDGRFLITLHGMARFRLSRQWLCEQGYRLAEVNFEAYASDFKEPETLPEELTRPGLINQLREYLARQDLTIDWDVAMHIPDHRFYTLLAMICPFSPAEKQALLEAETFEQRCHMMKCLMHIACAEQNDCNSMERPC